MRREAKGAKIERKLQYFYFGGILRATSDICKQSRIWSPDVILQVKLFINCNETREPAILVDIEVTEETCEEKPPEQRSKETFGMLIST